MQPLVFDVVYTNITFTNYPMKCAIITFLYKSNQPNLFAVMEEKEDNNEPCLTSLLQSICIF